MPALGDRRKVTSSMWPAANRIGGWGDGIPLEQTRMPQDARLAGESVARGGADGLAEQPGRAARSSWRGRGTPLPGWWWGGRGGGRWRFARRPLLASPFRSTLPPPAWTTRLLA